MGGGPDGLKTPGYCENHDCQCQSILFDCGTRHMFDFTFRPSDIVTQCESASDMEDVCSHNETLQLTFWKDPSWTRSLQTLGCERYEKTTLHSAMKYIESHVESMGVFSALKPATDPVWQPISTKLATTMDLEFSSFWPSTISESVSEQASPASKIFLGFMLLASLCLLLSGYTHQCKTVDLGTVLTPVISIQVNTVRQLLPPIGLILLAIVPMKPTSSIYNLCDMLMTVVHLCGAQFCFVAFLFCEALCLMDKKNVEEMTTNEFVLRGIIVTIGSVAMLSFVVFYAILMLFSGSEASPYVVPPFGGMSDMYYKSAEESISYLVRPAEGVWKVMKVLSYIAEFTVALSLLADLFVVWFFFHKECHPPSLLDYEDSDEFE